MRSKIALRLAALALGTAFASAPALAQGYLGPPQSPGIGPNGDARYGLYNEYGGYGNYNYAPRYYGRYSTHQRAYTDGSRPLIPTQSGHRFRRKSATHSD
jgi:hypothetical protein